jgi:hypothetical protein
MRTQLFDRWTDTRLFRVALLLAALVVAPVLALGLAVTVIGGGVLLLDGEMPGLEETAFGLLSAGGTLGMFGYLRAHAGAARPDRHNLTATLLCLAVGIATALAVACVAVFFWVLVTDVDGPWNGSASVGIPMLFVVANLLWAMSGIAWSQRLRRRYAEVVGHAFDSLPVLLLFVALALATAATCATVSL